MKKDNHILIQNIFTSNQKDIDGYHMFALTSIQMFYNFNYGCSITTLNTIFKLYNIKDSRAKQKIHRALLDLQELGLIDVNEISGKKTFNNNDALRIELCEPKKRYTLLHNEHVLQILSAKKSLTVRSNMLLVLNCISQYRGSNKYAFPSIETISEETGLYNKTVMQSIQLLEEMNILLVGRPKAILENNNTFRVFNNVYVINDIDNPEAVLKWATNKTFL